jgi:hypothetical protein
MALATYLTCFLHKSMPHIVDAAFFLTLLLVLVLWGWGVAPSRQTLVEATLLPPLAFLGTYAFVLWGVGSLFAFNTFVIVSLFALCLVLPLVLRGKSLAANIKSRSQNFRLGIAGLGRAEKWLSFYLALCVLTTFVLTLAPPIGSDYDSLVYHLAVPAQYLRIGKIVELPYDHHSYFPFTLEMLFGAGLALRGAIFAKLFHWLMLPACALVLIALGIRSKSRTGGFIAAALFVSMPMALVEASTAYIDLGFTAFALCAIYCFLNRNPNNENDTSHLIWSGAFCGFCIGTKFFGALFFGFIGLWLLAESFKSRRFAGIGAFAIPAILIGFPLYIRNFIWVGNPVFPFAYEVFGGEGWTLPMAQAYAADQARFGFGRSLVDLILLPWRLAMTPLSVGAFESGIKGQPFWPLFTSLPEGDKSGLFDVTGLFLNTFCGPALLALGAPALLLRSKPRPVLFAAWLFAFLWAFWAVSSQQIRYLFPALALLALVAGYGTVRILGAREHNDRPLAHTLAVVLLTIWLLFTPYLNVLWAKRSFPVLSGAMTQEEYVMRYFSGAASMDWINKNLPATAKFVVYGEPRCYYLEREYFWGDTPHNLLVQSQLDAGKSLHESLKNLGATHVLWNSNAGQNGGVFGPQPQFQQMVDSGQAKLIYGDSPVARGYLVYELK